MTISKIIEHFSAQSHLPVDLPDVAQAFKRHWVKDEFYFFEADTDPGILRGCIVEWDYPNDDSGYATKTVADIYYTKNDTASWKRFIICKEMIHLLDKSTVKITTKEEFDDLIVKITNALSDVDPFKDGEKANNDRFAELKALAILFPLASREIILPKYKTGKVTLEEIAKQADIPVDYVKMVMMDVWPIIHKSFLLEDQPTRRSGNPDSITG